MNARGTGRLFRHVWCIFAVAVLLFASCAPSAEKLLGYQEGRIEAELRGCVNSVEFSARLTLFEASEGEARAFELTMLLPKTLEGMVFRRSADGFLTASIGDLTVGLDAGESSGAVMIADAFSIDGEPIGISAVRGGDAGLPQYSELTRLEFSEVTVFLDTKTALPVKLVSPDFEIFVVSFKKP